MIFLSYSRNDQYAATLLHTQLEHAGLSVFKDDKNIRWSDLWLDKLQQAVDSCDAFVVLVGREGVRRWIGAETRVALNRYFGPHDDAKRLPIFPILLDGTELDTLPAFLRLFQGRPWNGRPGRPAVRWLEINGNSGSGKSSLMQTGLLPLIDKGWLWRPRSRYENWTRIGPMMPGVHPIEMLAECLARAFSTRMGDIVQELTRDDSNWGKSPGRQAGM